MMNQGGNAEVVVQRDPNSIENRHDGDASQGQMSPYLPSTAGSEAVSWTGHRMDTYPTENKTLSSFSYQNGQHSEPQSKVIQDGLNTSLASSSSLGTPNVSQQYNGYSVYPNPNDPYGYANTGYPGYYGGYQQQSNNAYTQPLGAYQNTGAPYQPISSFQNAGSYAGPASYSTTYYNTGDYQTAGGYPGSSYNNQATSWNEGSYANYAPHRYPNYTPESTCTYGSGAATPSSLQYQQHYKQWADYYSSTEVTCAPGTEKLSAPTASNPGSAVPAATGGYASSNIQPPPPITPSWRPESNSSDLTPPQPLAPTSGAYDSYWKYGPSGSQNHLAGPVQPQYQKPLDSYGSFQDQQKTAVPQGSNLQYSTAHQVPQNYQPSLQSTSSSDRRVSMVHIPTNPRIASNLPLGLQKIDKDSSTIGASLKPSYISVSLPKPTEKVSPHDSADSVLKPGMFPKSLRGYVERALARCKDDTQKAASQAYMKEMITKATADGTLFTRDWDTEPLFPLPDIAAVSKENEQCATPVSSLPKFPGRRSKSRWEPLPEEKPIDKAVSAANATPKYGSQTYGNEKDKRPLGGSFLSKIDAFGNSKFPHSEQRSASKSSQRQFKRQRVLDSSGAIDNGEASSDSDKEQIFTVYNPSARALLDCPEERKRRENRSKRFEKGQGNHSGSSYIEKNARSGNLYTRRATALMLSKSFEDCGNKAVEDIDWDALTVKGTCQEMEKRYLRLTSAPDPATVRPEEVLEKALVMVQNSQKNYLYKCDQLKSIRQDLTVQRIRNNLTVKVYETHARLALEAGDLPEYNQCQSQLKTLYSEGIKGRDMEFSAYNLLCAILHSNNRRDLLSMMSRLSDEAKKDEAVKHAFAVRAAVASGNYVAFFRLYKKAPNLNTCLMDLYIEKMRYKAVSCMSRAYRPTIPVSYVAKVLGFATDCPAEEGSDEDSVDIDECVEWLKAHGACLITDNNGEIQFDAKASSSTLYMPEPEDAVPHGDANLAVNDFLAKASS